MAEPYYYLNGAEFDAEPVPMGPAYMVASSPRSGSTLLCRLLWNRGSAGLPHEYFHRRHRAELSERWGVGPGLEGYLAELARRRTGGNGTFGFKAHFPQVEEAFLSAGADPAQAFPGLRVVYVYRSDRVSQAVSFDLASATGLWSGEASAWAATGAKPEYDFERLWGRLRRILNIENSWEAYFEERGLDPLRLRFEDLVADPERAADRVCDYVGVERTGEVARGLPLLPSQHEAANEEWARRLAADLTRRARPRTAEGG